MKKLGKVVAGLVTLKFLRYHHEAHPHKREQRG